MRRIVLFLLIITLFGIGLFSVLGQHNTTSAATPSLSASRGLRAGDVGFSLPTRHGLMWVYGDSWYNGHFIRSAITLNGKYTGFLAGVRRGHWIWPGAPWQRADGKIVMYGSENQTPAGKGPWQKSFVRGLKIVFDPRKPRSAWVTPTKGTVWAAEAVQWRKAVYVYSVNSKYQAEVARVDRAGNPQRIRTLGGFLGGHFSVVQDSKHRWWTVGLGGMLSRKLWAYRMAGPAGPMSKKPVLLAILPKPGKKRYTYAADIHPELGGLLTWAVNGVGPGTAYGLQKRYGWWPKALRHALGRHY